MPPVRKGPARRAKQAAAAAADDPSPSLPSVKITVPPPSRRAAAKRPRLATTPPPLATPPPPGTPQTSPPPTLNTAAAAAMATAFLVRRPPPRATATIDDLPDELLLKIFADLATVGPLYGPDPDRAARAAAAAGAPPPPPPPPAMPFRTLDFPGEPHPGLRAYPFLGQVCRRWAGVLDAPAAQASLWREVAVDFGHELITSVHTPIAWSDVRPSDDDFRAAFNATTLSADRIIRFIAARAPAIRRLVFANSEGYWSDDGDFVSLAGKHNFGPAHVGLVCGMLRDVLEEVVIQHCNDWLVPGGGGLAWGGPPGGRPAGGPGAAPGGAGLLAALTSLPRLRVLALEDVHCPLDPSALAGLSALAPSLEELVITADPHAGPAGGGGGGGGGGLFGGASGLASVPPSWAALTKLTRLELRGHTGLAALPAWLADLPSLAVLDVGGCGAALDARVVSACTTLRVLSLQGLRLGDASPAAGGAPAAAPAAAAPAAGGGAGRRRERADDAPPPPPPPPPPMARLGRAAAAMAGDLAAAAALDLDAAELPWPRQGGLPADGGRVALRDARARLPPWAVAVLPGDDGDFDDVDDELEAPEPGAVEDLMQVFRARWGAPAGEEAPGGGAGHARPPRRPLPDLSALTALTGLNLSDNELSTIPPVLLSGCLKSLRAVDLSSNGSLQIADGAGGLGAALLAALPSLRVLDLRAVHAEAGLGYWSAAKCSTMSALAGLAKAAKRKGGGPRILFDTD